MCTSGVFLAASPSGYNKFTVRLDQHHTALYYGTGNEKVQSITSCTMHHAPCTMHHAPCTMRRVPLPVQNKACAIGGRHRAWYTDTWSLHVNSIPFRRQPLRGRLLTAWVHCCVRD